MNAVTALLTLALHAAPPAPATAPGWIVEEEVVLTTDGAAPHRATRRTEIAGDRLRQEQSDQPAVFLLRASDTLPFVALDASSATWFGYDRATLAKADLPGAPLLEGIGVDASGVPFPPAEPFRATKTREKIGAWSAVRWEASAAGAGGQSTELWLAARPDGLANDAIGSILARVYSRKGAKLEPYFASMAKLPGFPVRTVRRITLPNGKKSEIRITATRIESADIALSRFELPSGYEQIADPIGLAK